MKKALVNFSLLVLAILCALVLCPFGIFATLLVAVLGSGENRPYVYVSNAAKALAYSIDLLGNVFCKDLFDYTLIKREGHRFGNPRETISAVLGHNKASATLTDGGRALANLLNWIEPGHVEIAAQEAATRTRIN